MPRPVMRYVKSSLDSPGPLVAMAQDLPQMIVTREAAFPVEFGVTGQELMNLLRDGARKFIRSMELQGLTLIPLQTGNPVVVTDEHGRPQATYSLTKGLDRSSPDEVVDHQSDGKGPATLKAPANLDEAEGLVDYRIVGVFWAPQVSVEIAKERQQLLDDEKAARNPRTWGSGKTVPDSPSIAIGG